MPAEESISSVWSREQDIQFEKAIANYAEDCLDRWEKIAADVPGKSKEEVKHHYDLLLDDVTRIESGIIPLPSYNSPSDGSNNHDETNDKKGSSLGHLNGDCNNGGGKSSRLDQDRRKGIAWTEDEHRLFLLGLDKYGKGDWRSISRNFVVTRTPTQVASHAQKYFIRLNSMNKDRRRSSIHDITSVNNNGEVSVPQAPITGQTNGSSVSNASNKSSKPQVPSAAPGVGIYGAPPIGQPISGPLVSAVGTPVQFPAPPPHLGFSVGAPVTGSLVPGAPINMAHMSYPMAHTTTQR